MSAAVLNALKIVQRLSREEQRELMNAVESQLNGKNDIFDTETLEELRRRNLEYDEGRMATVAWSDVMNRVARDEKQHG